MRLTSLCFYTGYHYRTIALNIDWLENQFELRYKSAPAKVFQTLVQSIEMIMEGRMH
jgi:hypothetical protein